MRARWSAVSISFCVLSLAACDAGSTEDAASGDALKEESAAPAAAPETPATRPETPAADPSAAPKVETGAVFTISNAAETNEVVAFMRDAEGLLSPAGVFPTGGRGTGKGLGSQGALALSADAKTLVVVDAGSNQITSFRVDGASLLFRSRVASGGTMPTSVAIHDGLVYALNAGEPANISGFKLDAGGMLVPIAGSTRTLSTAAAGPAQVSFSPKGDALVVTEKATNLIDTFVVKGDGTPSLGEPIASSGKTPFGFAFTPAGQLVVSEAFMAADKAGAVSSYAFEKLLRAGAAGDAERGLTTISASITNSQTAPCWVVVTPDGKTAFTTNTPSGTISAYAVGDTGDLKLVGDGAAAKTGDGSRPVDMTLDRGGKHLYVLNVGTQRIKGFTLGADATLTGNPKVMEVPETAFGLIGY